MAVKQDLKAAKLRELEEEQKRLAEAEAKKKAAAEKKAAAQAKANKETDLPGYKPSAKKTAETAKQTAKTPAVGTKQGLNDSMAQRLGAEKGQQIIENRKREKAAEQARAYKEADLPGSDGKAYQQRIESERLEYLNIKEARDKKSALEQELSDLRSGKYKNGDTVSTVAGGMRKGENRAKTPEDERAEELQREINALGKDITLAERTQNQKYLYKSAAGAEDFEKFSADPEKEEPEKRIEVYKSPNQKRETETVKGYMTEEERAVYNYYFNKFGEEKAEEFFDSIREDLNFRQAQSIFEGNEGKVLNEYLLGAVGGFENAKSGYQGAMRMFLGDDNYQPAGTYQYTSQMARDDLGKTGPKLPEALGGASLGQIGFDVVNTSANMLPSMILGTMGGGAIGAAAIGASAAGNAYTEMINAGYSKEQATNYSALVVASEASLGYLLGGIEATGGKLSKAAMAKILPKIDSALARTAANVSSKMVSEFTEEYLQEILDPVFRNIAFMEENEIDLLSEEAIYSGILGALSAGAMAMTGNSGTNAEVPVPFDGKAEPGSQAAAIADKITEIENRPISEAEKAAAIEKVIEVAAEDGTEPGLAEEAEKFREIHAEKAKQQEEAERAEREEYYLELMGLETRKKAEAKKVLEVGKRLGKTIEFDENITSNGKHFEDGRIVINPKSENPLTQILVHELTHDIETSGLYGDFSKKILEYVKNVQGIDLERMKQDIYEDYAKAGEILTPELQQRELVAKFAEQHLFTDEKAIERLCNTDQTLFQRIKYWISDMLVKLKGTAEEKFLREAERLYEKAWATRGETAGAGVEQSSLVGKNKDGYEVYITSPATMSLSLKDRQAQFLDIMKNQYRGRTAKFVRNGHTYYAKFEDADLNKNIYGDKYSDKKGYRAKIRAGADGDIFELVENATYNGSKPDTGKNISSHRNVNYWDYFVKTVQIDNGVFDLVANIRKKPNGDFVYSLQLNENKKIKASPPLGSLSRALTGVPNTSTINLAQTKPVVNNQGGNSPSLGRGFDELAASQSSTGQVNPDEDLFATEIDDFVDKIAKQNSQKKPAQWIEKDDFQVNPDEETDRFYRELMGFEDSVPSFVRADIDRVVNDPSIDSEQKILDLMEMFDKAKSPAEKSEIGRYIYNLRTNPKEASRTVINEGEAERVSAEVEASQSNTSQANTESRSKTSSMERADNKMSAEEWVGIAERINVEKGTWRMMDFSRVLDSAAGGNKILRQKLYELYEKPLNDAKGNYAKNYAAKVEGITKKFKELGIKSGSKESAAVQRIGEGLKEIDKHGNTTEYTLDDLKKEFPESWREIKAAADYCRKVYDEFLHDLNAMYSEIYPATVEQANERVSSYNGRIRKDAEYIDRYKEVIENLENRKAEKEAELAKKRPDSLIHAEIQNQIANIDHKIEVANERIKRIQNRKLTKEIARDTLVAQIENGEILRNKQIKPRKDYFRHFQELTDEFAEIADIFSNDQRIPPNLAGKSADTKPRTIWTSIAQSRKNGNYYTEDAVGGLLRYTEIAEKLLVFDPLISHFRDINSAIRAAGVMADNEVKGKGTNAGQFASWADDMTNQLAGKTNKLDRIISDNTGAVGRAVVKAVEVLNRRVKSNAILGNFRSAIVQVGNLPNATLYVRNPKDWAHGAISTLESLGNKSSGANEARKQSSFMNRRYMGDYIDKITKDIQQNKLSGKLKESAIWMLGAGDRAAAELIWHTAYTQALRNPNVLFDGVNKLRNYDSAIDYADDITRRSIGGRAEGEIPYFEESKIMGLVAPFQIEVANTFNAFSEQIGKKNAAGIIAFEIGVFLTNCVLEAITGDRPLGLDYIDAGWDILKNTVAPEDDDEEEKDFWDFITYTGGRIAGETISGMPMGAQIGSAITGGDEQKAEDWFGENDPTRYGTGNIGMGALADAADYFIDGSTPEKFIDLATDGKKNSYGEWSEPILETFETFAPVVMPWGGKQLSRTLRGADQLIRGGAYGTEADGSEYMKFPQSYKPGDVAKTVLFGQYAGSTGQDYIDSGFKHLSAKQTEQMKHAEKWGITNDEFYRTIMGFRQLSTDEEKKEALYANDEFTSGEKGILEQIIFGDANKPYQSRDYSSGEAFVRSGLSDSERRLFDYGYSEDEIDVIENAFKGGRNKGESIDYIESKLGLTEAEAFEAYSRRKGDWIDELSGEDAERAQGATDYYGMSTEEYKTVLNLSKFGAQIKKADGTEEYSTSAENVIPNIAKALGVTEKRAEELYNRVTKYEYTKSDLEPERVKDLETSAEWYGVDEKGYFIARNAIKTAEGEKDKYGKTISGTEKAAAIKEISSMLEIDAEEAAVYYLAAKGELVLSKEDLTSAKRADLEEAMKHGWTERQYLDAVNVVKLSGASKKDDIIKALQDAGATYEMAVGYYNLTKNYDYYKRS